MNLVTRAGDQRRRSVKTAPRVLVSPDKFKGSLAGIDVARAIAGGIRKGRPTARVLELPVADGGEGTLDAALAAGFERVEVTVSGPTGHPVRTAFARRGNSAVVELADSCGVSRLPEGVLHGMTASSRGLGEAVVAALDAGCREIVIGIGGSASTDGGAGLASALGAVLTDGDGGVLGDGGAELGRLHALDIRDLHPALGQARLVVACDVDNPLIGDNGAAAIYGPQKGLTTDSVQVLDASLGHWADVVAASTGSDWRDVEGAGAAGGVGFGALALLGATLRPGITLMLDLLGFHEVITDQDLVITGEGSLDEQSLRGKAPVGVAAAAHEHDVPVIAVCGRRLLDTSSLQSAHISDAYALLDVEPDSAICMRETRRLLGLLGEQIAKRHLS